MIFARPIPIARTATLPALLLLAACGTSNEPASDPAPRASEEALSYVANEAGAPRAELAAEIERHFTSEPLAETRAMLVLHDGELVAERYGEGYGPETRFVSWSMAKTVTAVLIGMLVADGKLALDETPPIPEWRRAGDPRGAITLRHLLQMRSGLRHTEAGERIYESDEVRMLFLDGRDDMAAHARGQPLEAEPGEEFEYSSNTTVILADIAARALAPRNASPDERREVVANYLEARLFGPLDMETMLPEYDAAGTMVGGSLMHATARDWAKFGEFLRRKGEAEDGTQLVPSGWIEFMLTPAPTSPHYGGQTWLNRASGGDWDPLFPDKAPDNVFAALGHLGQHVIVSPEQGLTLVRLGKTNDADRQPVIDALGDIVALYPVREDAE